MYPFADYSPGERLPHEKKAIMMDATLAFFAFPRSWLGLKCDAAGSPPLGFTVYSLLHMPAHGKLHLVCLFREGQCVI